MTISTTDNRKEYAGDGTSTAFSFPYYFLKDADLVVKLVKDSTGVETLQVITTHYTLAGAGDSAGGTVTMLIAPPTGDTLIIFRDPALTQDVDLVENDSLPVETAVEEPLDLLTMIGQRTRELIERSIRLPEGDTGFVAADLILPSSVTRKNKILGFDANGKLSLTLSTIVATAFIDTLLDDVDAAAARTTLGVVIGTDVQAFDATLLSLAALGTAANKLAYTTAVDTWAESALTAAGRALIDDADVAAQRTTLGVVIGTDVQAFDATLLSLAALGTAADKLAYTTALDTWAESALTAAGRALIDDADVAAQRTTLGVVIGTDVQAFDATLLSLAALGTAADKLAYTTGVDTWAEAALTAAGRALIDDANAAAQRTTLGLVIGTDVQAWDAVLDNTTASYTTAEETKLAGIETSADVTDATNVAAAGGVLDTGNETIAGVKTFSSDPLIPDEAYGVGWDASLEPPTKNAVYDKIQTISGGEVVLKAVKPAAESVTSSTTMQDDDDLTITLVANKTYKFDAELVAYTTSGTPDFKYEWVEADGTYILCVDRIVAGSATTGEAGVVETSGPKPIQLATSVGQLVSFEGMIRTGGAGGVFKLQWAQNTSNATPTQLLAGSFMRAVELD